MTEYNVGDRVRVKTYQGTGWHGLVGTIVDVTELLHTVYSVDFDNPPQSFFRSGDFDVGDLELVESASTDSEGGDAVRKFSKGDRVRIIGESLVTLRQAFDDETIEDIVCTIVDHNDDFDTWSVLPDEPRLRSPFAGGRWSVEASDIELIVPVEACDAPAKSTKPRRITPAETAKALVGDDRPATNGDDFEAAMLAMLIEQERRERKESA